MKFGEFLTFVSLKKLEYEDSTWHRVHDGSAIRETHKLTVYGASHTVAAHVIYTKVVSKDQLRMVHCDLFFPGGQWNEDRLFIPNAKLSDLTNYICR